jgi:signal transduction histidine kinase
VRLGSHVRGAIGEERQAAALVAVLVGVFIATAALALQSWRDDRARRTEAEDALRRTGAYAMVAYRTRIEGALWNALVALFRPVGGRLGRTGDPPPLASLSESFSAVEQCRCLPVLAPRYLFRLDLRTGALEISGTGADSALRSWLAAGVPWHLRPGHATLEFDAMSDSARAMWEPAFFTFFRDTAQRPLVAYGFGTTGDALVSAVLEPALRQRSLLAPLIPDSMTNAALFRIAAVAGGRHPVYGTPEARTLASGRLPDALGGLELQLGLQPGAADRLLPGGPPRPRAPFLVGTLLAAAALVALGLTFARRVGALARQRADFTASVSHELRTPLAEIMLFAETMALGRYRTIADYRREAAVIVQEGRRLLHLVENVLHVSRAERAAVKPAATPAPLAPLVRRALASYDGLAAAHGVIIRTELDDAVAAPADGPALERVVLNLLDNAVKYAGHAGPVTVAVTRRREQAEIRVDDAGPGVPAGDRERIWEPFVRLARDRSDSRTGGGLGLTVVRDIVRCHGGTAHVEGSPSGGARFVVRIPGAEYAQGPG